LKGEDFLGCITQTDVLQEMARIVSADQPGGILVFEMTIHDYSMTEIARSVEEKQGRILSSFVETQGDTTEIFVTIKLTTNELSGVTRSFERYNYHLMGAFMESVQLDDMYQDRYDEFMRYLSI